MLTLPRLKATRMPPAQRREQRQHLQLTVGIGHQLRYDFDCHTSANGSSRVRHVPQRLRRRRQRPALPAARIPATAAAAASGLTAAADRALRRHAPSKSEGLDKWWGVLFHTCHRQYPGGTGRCSHRSLPDRWQPSPFPRRVGFRITCFEACAAFTRVVACVVAEPPEAARCIGVLQTMSLPPPSAPTATGWSDSCRAGFAPAEDWRLLTAHAEIHDKGSAQALGWSPSRPPGTGDRRRRETGAVLSGTNARSGRTVQQHGT